MSKLTIQELGSEDRPREKFEANGGASLSKAELLAILIGSGNVDENAVQLMQRLMNDCDGNLGQLGRMTISDLCQYKGIGPAKAITILAACELTNRRMGESSERKQVTSSADIYALFRGKMRDLAHEESHVLLLNHSLRVLGTKVISRGGMTGTVVDIRMVLKEALQSNATHIALCHNHPSGTLRPSRDDDRLTERLSTAAKTVDITLIDHVIVTDRGYYSYQDEGRL